jgi:hypothetical protein
MKLKYTILYEYEPNKTFSDFKKEFPKCKSKKEYEEKCSQVLLKLLNLYMKEPDEKILEIKTRIIDE